MYDLRMIRFAIVVGALCIIYNSSTANETTISENLACLSCVLCHKWITNKNNCENFDCLKCTNISCRHDPYFTSFYNANKFDSLSGSCMSSQLVQSTSKEKDTQPLFFMINDCQKNFSDTENLKKCRDSSNTQLHLNDFTTNVPVTVKLSNLTYRNTYCGLCNNVQKDTLDPWEVNLSCNFDNDIGSIADISHYVLINQKCSLVAIPPDYVKERVCDAKFMDSKLLSTKNSSVKSFAEQYGDAFCNKCIFTNNSSNFCLSKVTSTDYEKSTYFYAMLDTQVLHSDNITQTSGRCEPQQVFDNDKKVCRTVECSSGFLYLNGTCKSIFKAEAMRSYEMYYNFRSSIFIHYCAPSWDMSVLLQHINRTLQSSMEGIKDLNMFIYKFRVLYYPYKHCVETSAYFPDHFYVHLFLFSNGRSKIDIINKTIGLDNLIVTVGKIESNVTLFYNGSLDGRDFNNRGYLGMYYTDPESGADLEVVTEMQNPHFRFKYIDIRRIRITKQLICPRIHFTSSEVTTQGSKHVCVFETKHCFCPDQYTKTKSGIYICKDLYISKLNNETEVTPIVIGPLCDPLIINNDQLKILSMIMSIISITCLSITILTLTLSGSSRKKSSKITLLVCISQLLVKILLLFVIPMSYVADTLCQVMGGLLHYFYLIPLMWMNVGLFHFHPNLKLQRPNDPLVFVKYILICFGIPLIFVLMNIMFSLVNSDWTDFGYGRCLCFISNAVMIGYTYVLPLFFTVIVNGSLFVSTFEERSTLDELVKMKAILFQKRYLRMSYAKLSCITCATWLLTIIYTVTHLQWITYLFFLLNTAQDVFLLLTFGCSMEICFKCVKCFENGNSKMLRIDKVTKETDN